jgi:hypothetical protein
MVRRHVVFSIMSVAVLFVFSASMKAYRYILPTVPLEEEATRGTPVQMAGQ